MTCVIRECSECGYCDCRYPPPAARYVCPKCGGDLEVEFDEEGDHEWREEE